MYQTPGADAALSELVSNARSQPESSCQKLQTPPTGLHTNCPGADLPSVRHSLLPINSAKQRVNRAVGFPGHSQWLDPIRPRDPIRNSIRVIPLAPGTRVHEDGHRPPPDGLSKENNGAKRSEFMGIQVGAGLQSVRSCEACQIKLGLVDALCIVSKGRLSAYQRFTSC